MTERALSDTEIRRLDQTPETRNSKSDRRKAFFSYVPPEMDRRSGKDRRAENNKRSSCQ